MKHATPTVMGPLAQIHAVLIVQTDADQKMEIAMLVWRVCLESNATKRAVLGV